MVLELVSPRELGRALGVEAGARDLPVTARSRTPAEKRAPAWREIGWMVLVYLLFAAACYATVRLASTNPLRVDWLPALFGGAALLLVIVAWRKLARHGGYRDPGLEVEVGEEGVTVTGPDGRDARPFAELAVSRVLTRTTRNSVYFDGIVLDTSFGPVELGDEGFTGGNAAAGAILRKLDELELAPAHAA